MKKLIFSLTAIIICWVSAGAGIIELYNPGYFNNPIRDGYPLFPDGLTIDSEAEELTFPDMGLFVRLCEYGEFPNLRKVTLGDIDYMPRYAFRNMPLLEEIEINGLVGHIDCELAADCPNLRKIVFNGPVSAVSGTNKFASDCPRLETVVFNSVVGLIYTGLPENCNVPLKKFTCHSTVLKASDSSLIEMSVTDTNTLSAMEQLAEWQEQVLNTNHSLKTSTCSSGMKLLTALEQAGSTKAATLKAALSNYIDFDDETRTPLEKLRLSPAYAPDPSRNERFEYATPDNALLTLTRERFNLDSIAGTGDDVSRIKNLLYWVHDNIPHNGNNGYPRGEMNLRNIYDSAHRDSCGYNCRVLAIALTEALLAEGIPARYLTCESKAWDTDGDCHVICMAWSRTLGKWIWVDPSFAAYVTDDKGLLLHPGEVRYRLKHDLPLVLNPDANWNHQSMQTKEYYLETYMAKNLYIMSCNMLNQANPEGEADHPKGQFVALTPQKSNYTATSIITTDDNWFWQSPE